MFYFLFTDTAGDVTNSGKQWNILAPNITNQAVVDESNSASALTVTVPGISLYPNLVTISFPWSGDGTWYDEEVGDPLWINSDAFFTMATVNGLDSGKTYIFEFVGAYDSTSDRVAKIRINSGTEVQYNIPNQPNINTEQLTVSGTTSAQIEVARTVTGSSYILGFRVYEDVPPADTTPPAFDTAPNVTATTDSGHSIGTTLSEPGTVYGLRMTNGATPPADDTEFTALYNGGVTGDVLEIKSAAAGNSATLVFSTGSASTAYDYYILAEDDEGTPNVQASPTLVEATTAAAQVPGITQITAQSEGAALQLSDWEIKVRLESDQSVIYDQTNQSSNASGQIAAFATTGGSVGDAVRVECYSATGPHSFIIKQNLEDTA